jgi:hemoglobin
MTFVTHKTAFALLALGLPAWTALGAPAPDSLYRRMGGEPVVRAVVSETLDHVVADPKLKRSYANVDVERVKRLVVQQICELAGGGCKYTGDSMREVHAGHQISEAEFFGLTEILRDSMRRHHVRLRERNELLVLLSPMERDIVNIPVPPTASTDP